MRQTHAQGLIAILPEIRIYDQPCAGSRAFASLAWGVPRPGGTSLSRLPSHREASARGKIPSPARAQTRDWSRVYARRGRRPRRQPTGSCPRASGAGGMPSPTRTAAPCSGRARAPRGRFAAGEASHSPAAGSPCSRTGLSPGACVRHTGLPSGHSSRPGHGRTTTAVRGSTVHVGARHTLGFCSTRRRQDIISVSFLLPKASPSFRMLVSSQF
jgi:hypothetical protein